MLKDKVIMFTFVLLPRLRHTFVSLITLHVLLNLELVLPVLEYGFIIRFGERVTF